MKFRYWLTCAVSLLAYSHTFCQKKLVPVLDIIGTESAWLHDVTSVNKKLFIIDGSYKGQIALGQDTLISGVDRQEFVTQFKKDAVSRSMTCEGIIAGVDREFFCLVDNETFTRPVIAKFNLNNQLIWKYSLSFTDSFPAFLHLVDIGFDKDNTYLLFMISTENGQTHFSNEVITGSGNLIVKLDSRGELSAFKKIADVDTYNKLKIVNEKICFYSVPTSINHVTLFLDLDLQEEMHDNELRELLKFPIWDNKEYFRIAEHGWRPKRLFILEKYSSETGATTRTEPFRDTAKFQDEIYRHEILNFGKKEIVIVYVSQGPRTGNWYLKPQIHVLLINKKTLEIQKRIVIDCDHLTSETAKNMCFKVYEKGLLIGSTYKSNCRVGNLSFGNNDDTKWSSFFVVKQPLK